MSKTMRDKIADMKWKINALYDTELSQGITESGKAYVRDMDKKFKEYDRLKDNYKRNNLRKRKISETWQ